MLEGTKSKLILTVTLFIALVHCACGTTNDSNDTTSANGGTSAYGGASGAPISTAGATSTASSGTGGAGTSGGTTSIGGGPAMGGMSTGGSGGAGDSSRAGAGGVAGAVGVGGGGGSPPAGKSSGCGKNTAKPNDTTQQTMMVGGKMRSYLLSIPSSYSPEAPLSLIFVFHGRGMNNVWASQGGIDWAGKFELQALSAGRAITVFPQGSGDPPGNSPNFSGTSNWGNDDLPFFDALWTDLESKYCIDPRRVFSTGFSMGGMFTNTLGCERASVIRAVAPIAGWGPNASPSGSAASCSKSMGKLASMVFHGTADTVVTYTSGQASAEFWRKDDTCMTATQSSSAYPGCVTYQGCAAGHDVHFCSHGGEHTVPGGAGANIWKFFSSLP